MKFSGKISLMILLNIKVTKNHGFTLSLKKKKKRENYRGGQFHPPRALLGLR